MTRLGGSQTALSKAAAALSAIVLAFSLASCAGPEPVSSPSLIPSGSPSPIAEIQFYPDGTAEENLPWFRQAAQKVFVGPQKGVGQAYLDALVAAGFDPAAMEVGRDHNTINEPAETLSFSVLWNETSCLVGQAGSSIPELVTGVAAPVGPRNRCLVGSTVQNPPERP